MPDEDRTPTTAAVSAPGGRRVRWAAPLLVASLALLGACGDDDAGDGVTPADQDPLPAQQPEGDEDPTQSGDETPGVGTAETGGSGAGAPDAGAGAGSGAGEADDG